MSHAWLRGLAGSAAAAALLSPAFLALPASAQAAAPSPAKVAKKLFHAWLKDDHDAAALVATPSAVNSIFAYVYRAPDKFAGCTGNVCRFVHTSVNVPGDLDGLLMIVFHGKVTKVYRSRHLTTQAGPAKHLFKAWQQNDRYRGLEVAKQEAVTKLFSVKYDPKGVKHFFQGCTAEPKGFSCAYSYEGGAMFMHVGGSKSRGYEVRSISYIAD